MFSTRSREKEWLDRVEIPEADLFQNLDELDFINHWLGGYSVSFDALKKLDFKKEAVSLVDIGCGGGDTLSRLGIWAQRRSLKIDLHGIDIKETCIRYAQKKHQRTGISFFCDDYKNLRNHLKQVDIIHASLFCHHLSEEELISLVQFAGQMGAVLIINDLNRHPLAYYSIKWLTALFSDSYLVKNDAPLSVLRGFTLSEWQEILSKAGAKNFRIKWKWAFRHQIIVWPDGESKL